MAENVYLVRIGTGEVGNTYRYLVGIECSPHRLSGLDSVRSLAKLAYNPGREIRTYTATPYKDTLPDRQKEKQSCGCWTMLIGSA